MFISYLYLLCGPTIFLCASSYRQHSTFADFFIYQFYSNFYYLLLLENIFVYIVYTQIRVICISCIIVVCSVIFYRPIIAFCELHVHFTIRFNRTFFLHFKPFVTLSWWFIHFILNYFPTGKWNIFVLNF